MQTQNEQLIADRYSLLGLIRSHGSVLVYAGQDLQLDRPVMVQRLAESVPVDSKLARAFLRHQQVAASIHNCPVLGVYDAGSWEGRPFSVMESEKGKPASALYRPGHPPDVFAALRITRQAAEALQCCRDAGLTDWAFAPEAVSIDAEGNGCLAIIEGLEGRYSSNAEHHDGQALGGLLRLLLAGNDRPLVSDQPIISDEETVLIPSAVAHLLDRMIPGKANSLRTAEEIAQAIAAIEQAAHQPTESYDAPIVVPHTQANDGATPMAVAASLPSEEPTVAAQATPAVRTSATTPLGGYVPTKAGPEMEGEESGRSKWLPLMALIGVLLLVVGVLAVALPGLRTLRAGAGANPTVQTQKMVPVADLRGKSLDDARNVAGEAGLNISLGDPLYDSAFPIDAVARQEPDPGTQLQAGSLVTVSLSLGPEAQPTTPPQKAGPAPQPPAPKVAPAPRSHGREKNDDRKKGKD